MILLMATPKEEEEEDLNYNSFKKQIKTNKCIFRIKNFYY